MKFTKRVQFVLLAGLIALNIIMRLPTTPHEIGWDSFDIHILANSVSAFGEARWWFNTLSVGGFYPLSYASAVPFMLSGISQLTGMDMEWTIWLFCVITGLLSAFGAYLLAGEIWDNDFFKFVVALGYSTSLGILSFTTWTTTTRGFLIVLLPLFIYLLLKCRTSALRYGIFTFILFALFVVTHHIFYFTISIIISYFVLVIFYISKGYINVKSIKIHENWVNIGIFVGFIIMFLIPFFTRDLWLSDPEAMRCGVTSRYTLLSFMLSNYVRYVGCLLFLIIGGYFYILLKRGKRFEEWFLLLALLSLAPLLYLPTYMKWVAGLFAFLLIGVALSNIAIIKTRVRNKKYIVLLIVGLLLFSMTFNGYYQFIHFLNDPSPRSRYMQDATYVGGLWIKDNIDKNLFYNNPFIGLRTFSISETPTLFGEAMGQAYGFESPDELDIIKIYPLSTSFYADNPYVKKLGTSYLGGRCNLLRESKINSYYGNLYINKYNISYIIEDEDIGDNVFMRSVHPTEGNLYDNGKIRIWRLD